MRSFPILCLALCALNARAAALYSGDGTPGAREEFQRWAINRSRYAPEREADRLGLTNTTAGGHPDYDVAEDGSGTNDFGATTNAWAPWILSKPPLAPNARLNTAAIKHARDMAETGLFQHPSPSSNYYPLGSIPLQRHLAEGYTNTITGYYENIAYGNQGFSGGYPAVGRDVTNVYTELFIDTSAVSRGHRQAILNSTAREIGLGTFRTNSFAAPFYYTYDYDVEDFGRSASNHFFTDTIYRDGNTNGVMDQNEGVGNVEVHLWNGTNEAAWYDVSQPGGSFAVPINDLPDGNTIWVEVRNGGTATNITLPLGYTLAGDVSLAASQSCWFGTFRQPLGSTNVGFRNCEPWTENTAMAGAGDAQQLSFSGLRRARYVIETAASPTGLWSTVSTITATASVMSVTLTNGADAGFYRSSVLRD